MKKPATITFNVRGEFIELIRLLKAVNLAESGGHAKLLVEQGIVKVNGAVESRKRAKLKPGDTVTCLNTTIILESED